MCDVKGQCLSCHSHLHTAGDIQGLSGVEPTCNLLWLADLLQLILSLGPVVQLLLAEACVLYQDVKYFGVNLCAQERKSEHCLASGV